MKNRVVIVPKKSLLRSPSSRRFPRSSVLPSRSLSAAIVSKSVTSPLVDERKTKGGACRGCQRAQERARGTRTVGTKNWPFWPPPKPMSGQHLDSSVALPVYRTFMAHNIKSSPWYPYCIIRDAYRPLVGVWEGWGGGGVSVGRAAQLLFGAILYRPAHTYDRETPEIRNNPSRWSSASSANSADLGSGVGVVPAVHRDITRAEIQSAVRFIPSGEGWKEEHSFPSREHSQRSCNFFWGKSRLELVSAVCQESSRLVLEIFHQPRFSLPGYPNRFSTHSKTKREKSTASRGSKEARRFRRPVPIERTYRV